MRTLAALLLTLLAAPAFAGEASGVVHAVYYEAARGVMVDASILVRPGAKRWADVELSDSRRIMVQVPTHLRPRAGDTVAVQLGDKATAVASVLSVDRVVAIRAEPSAGVGR
jgi:hypothetical protein